jgi:hypothetical protein
VPAQRRKIQQNGPEFVVIDLKVVDLTVPRPEGGKSGSDFVKTNGQGHRDSLAGGCQSADTLRMACRHTCTKHTRQIDQIRRVSLDNM